MQISIRLTMIVIDSWQYRRSHSVPIPFTKFPIYYEVSNM